MASTQTARSRSNRDGLIRLQSLNALKYRKGQLIYDAPDSAPGFYKIVDGMVKVSRLTDRGRFVVVDIYQRDEVFGESTFLPLSPPSERAAALEDTELVSWTGPEIAEIVSRQPQVAVQLMRVILERTAGFTERIESLCTESTESRLERTLIRFGNRMGCCKADGSVHLPPLTHELLSQFIGTSREQVSLIMTRLRRRGLISYSRQEITVHRDAALEWNTSQTGGRCWVCSTSV